MKRIVLMALLSFLLLLLLFGCGSKADSMQVNTGPDDSEQDGHDMFSPEAVSPAPFDQDTIESQIVEPSPEPKLPELDFSCDESSCTPWQVAYLTLLRDIVNRETPERIALINGDSDEDIQLSESYCLYDVDKDEIPEFFIKFGCCEADYRTEVYTFQNGSIDYVGEFGSGHSSLYTWPGENAVLLNWGHMGYAEMYKISSVAGDLAFEDIFTEDISEDPEADYTEPSEIVPGSIYLPQFWTMLNREEILSGKTPPSTSLFMPLTLPIYDYYPDTSPSKKLVGGDTKKAVAEVLAGKREMYGVSGDGFGEDMGWISIHDYSMQIRKSGWVDFNQDGREEYIIDVQASELSGLYLILSEQDGVVYAYSIDYFGDHEILQDGIFVGEYRSFGISFYKNQCYTYEKAHDPNTTAITWEP